MRCPLHRIISGGQTSSNAAAVAREKEEQAFDGVWVMMNGLPGKMGIDVAAACLRKGIRVAPYALTGDGIDQTEITVDDQEVGRGLGVRVRERVCVKSWNCVNDGIRGGRREREE